MDNCGTDEEPNATARRWSGSSSRNAGPAPRFIAPRFQGKALTFTPAQLGKAGDVLVIPKARTELPQCRDEFFRIMINPKLFP